MHSRFVLIEPGYPSGVTVHRNLKEPKVLPELAGITPTQLASAPPKELEIVDTEITKVIKALDDEITELDEVEFPVKGHIARHSLGGGELSPLLANHHARAHNVTIDTLVDLRKDLNDFRDAIRETRTLLGKKDEESATEARRILTGTEDLDLGALAYQNAQGKHANDTATDKPDDTDEGEG